MVCLGVSSSERKRHARTLTLSSGFLCAVDVLFHSNELIYCDRGRADNIEQIYPTSSLYRIAAPVSLRSNNTPARAIYSVKFPYVTCITAPKSFFVRSLSRNVSGQNSLDDTIFAPSNHKDATSSHSTHDISTFHVHEFDFQFVIHC